MSHQPARCCSATYFLLDRQRTDDTDVFKALLHERQRMYACVGIIPVGARGAKGGIGDISMKNYWTITTGPRTGDNDSGSAVLEHKITGGYLDCKWEPARLSLGTCGVPRFEMGTQSEPAPYLVSLRKKATQASKVPSPKLEPGSATVLPFLLVATLSTVLNGAVSPPTLLASPQ
ncbi:hypothetical protein NEUTE2DRAFT_128583 [Neurospora tetrasperma FGSC 2509]|nr:hypothetical protein NEUTE2DRAFT_128583 [Neurospora tetrasperma FGSC 2509]